MISKQLNYLNVFINRKEVNKKEFLSPFHKLLLLDENLRENFFKGVGFLVLNLEQGGSFSDNILNDNSHPQIINYQDQILNIPIISFIDASDINSVVIADIKRKNKELIRFREEWGL